VEPQGFKYVGFRRIYRILGLATLRDFCVERFPAVIFSVILYSAYGRIGLFEWNGIEKMSGFHGN
jgi:hypothetical protein